MRRQGSVQTLCCPVLLSAFGNTEQETVKHLEVYFEVDVYCFSENVRKKARKSFLNFTVMK